jgi:cephalosporin-C deacetylase-like acetyl esterase
MILNYLESRGDLDMTRVGMFGHGSGASIAIRASAADPRIRVVDTVDPWGDWPTWMAKSPFVPEDERADLTKPEFLKKAAVLEPVDWLPKSQATKFRMQDAIFDKITPKEAKEKLRAAVPKDASVVIYKTPAEFNEMIRNKTELDWIKLQVRFVSPLITTQTATAAKP